MNRAQRRAALRRVPKKLRETFRTINAFGDAPINLKPFLEKPQESPTGKALPPYNIPPGAKIDPTKERE